MNRNFEINGEKITLRNFNKSAIKNYVNWFFYDKEWQEWDAPWEELKFTEEDFQKWIISRVIKDKEEFKWNLEIFNGENHVGWVLAYKKDEDTIGIGIVIPDKKIRGKGIGSEAFELYLNYTLKNFKDKSIIVETWTENKKMIGLAKKYKFKEKEVLKNFKEKNGKKYDEIVLQYIGN